MSSFADGFFKTRKEALEELARRRSAGSAQWVNKIEPSPYGDGYRLRSIPVEFMVETTHDLFVPATKLFSQYPLAKRKRKFG